VFKKVLGWDGFEQENANIVSLKWDKVWSTDFTENSKRNNIAWALRILHELPLYCHSWHSWQKYHFGPYFWQWYSSV